MTRRARLLTLVAASAAIGANVAPAQTVTLTARDRETVVVACESGQDVLPIAYDDGSPYGVFAVPILNSEGEAVSAVMLTRSHLASLPECDLSAPMQGFAGDANSATANEDAA